MGLYNCIGRNDERWNIFVWFVLLFAERVHLLLVFYFRLLKIIHLSRSGPCTLYFIFEVLLFSLKINPLTLSTRLSVFNVWLWRRHVLNPSEDNHFNLFWDSLICLVLDYNSWLNNQKKQTRLHFGCDRCFYIYQMLLLIIKDSNTANL